jgi:4-oxalocrotonate tautomerase
MPILDVKVSAPRSEELTGRLTATLAELTVSVLGKKPELIAIAVTYVDPRDWFVAGRSLAAQGKSSVYLVIKITDETNTKDEKARFIREAYAAFGRLLPDLHEESYIHVEDVRAAAYGYGGRTQEHRYQHPAP